MHLSRKRKGLPCEMASGKTGNLHGKSEGLSDETDGSDRGKFTRRAACKVDRCHWKKGGGMYREGPQRSENKAMRHVE